jgi:dynein heavy chain, axonemal
MARGIPPREASDRLTIFQAKFDELWRKFETYSAGEDLFGLQITEYPDLQRIKRVCTRHISLSLEDSSSVRVLLRN